MAEAHAGGKAHSRAVFASPAPGVREAAQGGAPVPSRPEGRETGKAGD